MFKPALYNIIQLQSTSSFLVLPPYVKILNRLFVYPLGWGQQITSNSISSAVGKHRNYKLSDILLFTYPSSGNTKLDFTYLVYIWSSALIPLKSNKQNTKFDPHSRRLPPCASIVISVT